MKHLSLALLLCCGAMGQTGGSGSISHTTACPKGFTYSGVYQGCMTTEDWPDVPAIQVHKHVKSGLVGDCHVDPAYPNTNLLTCSDEYIDYDVTSCTDKSRILLTAEDGKKFCHKVQAETGFDHAVRTHGCFNIATGEAADCEPTEREDWLSEFGRLDEEGR